MKRMKIDATCPKCHKMNSCASRGSILRLCLSCGSEFVIGMPITETEDGQKGEDCSHIDSDNTSTYDTSC